MGLLRSALPLALLLPPSAADASSGGGSASATRPNLMFMMTDQQRWDTMSAVTPSLSTPNMDRIAKEGVLFKWGYSSTPTCTPARAAILTGQVRSPRRQSLQLLVCLF